MAEDYLSDEQAQQLTRCMHYKFIACSKGYLNNDKIGILLKPQRTNHHTLFSQGEVVLYSYDIPSGFPGIRVTIKRPKSIDKMDGIVPEIKQEKDLTKLLSAQICGVVADDLKPMN